jgi:hypothetical protein
MPDFGSWFERFTKWFGGEDEVSRERMEKVMFYGIIVILFVAMFAAIIYRIDRMENKVQVALDESAAHSVILEKKMDSLQQAIQKEQASMRAVVTRLVAMEKQQDQKPADTESIKQLAGILEKQLDRNSQIIRELAGVVTQEQEPKPAE